MAEPKDREEGAIKRFLGVVEKIGLKAIATGNFGWFILLVIAGGIVWKLQSSDLKEVLLRITTTLGWLGYPVAGITILVSVRILRWREQFFNDEMRRMADVRNEAVQERLKLPLQSSIERRTENEKRT